MPSLCYLVRRITQTLHDEIATDLEKRQQELNDRLKLLTNDNKQFQVTASYLLDLAQRADQLFKESDEGLRQKLLEYVLSNIELKDKKLSYILNDPFKSIVEAKKKAFRLIIQTFGATEQNLLKLLGWIISSPVQIKPEIPSEPSKGAKIIY